jgi:hypothetical protein
MIWNLLIFAPISKLKCKLPKREIKSLKEIKSLSEFIRNDLEFAFLQESFVEIVTGVKRLTC